MKRWNATSIAVATAVVSLLALPAVAPAAGKGGKTSASPKVTSVSKRTVRPGQLLVIRGKNLSRKARVTFLGGRGRSDDRAARPRRGATSKRIVVVVPRAARSGPIRVRRGKRTAAKRPRVTVLRAKKKAAPPAAEETEDPCTQSEDTPTDEGEADGEETGTEDGDLDFFSEHDEVPCEDLEEPAEGDPEFDESFEEEEVSDPEPF